MAMRSYVCFIGTEPQGTNFADTQYAFAISILVSEDLQSGGIYLLDRFLLHYVCVPLLAHIHSKIQKVSAITFISVSKIW